MSETEQTRTEEATAAQAELTDGELEGVAGGSLVSTMPIIITIPTIPISPTFPVPEGSTTIS
jgi:hypothetical protein